jgi:hypothetical protein
MEAFARNTDPTTSHEAAKSVGVLSDMEQTVFDVIKQFPLGCIADEIEDKLPGKRLVSISPRFKPLINKGFIVDTGEKREGRSGRKQRVMLAVEQN